MRLLVGALLGGALGIAGPAAAQVVQTFQYDANGRLTAVSTTSAGGSHSSTYAYDDADNRTARSQVGTGVYASSGAALIHLAGAGRQRLRLWRPADALAPAPSRELRSEAAAAPPTGQTAWPSSPHHATRKR